jgi:hypothetical protein
MGPPKMFIFISLLIAALINKLNFTHFEMQLGVSHTHPRLLEMESMERLKQMCLFLHGTCVCPSD